MDRRPNDPSELKVRADARPRPRLRSPRPEDGARVWELVRACAPLDENSMYCNLLQCDHFAGTCVIAELGGEAVGWISAYIPPEEPDTLFVWQVAVSERARGLGLAKRMLAHLLEREACAGVERLRTTITRDNAASWALFSAFARDRAAPMARRAHYTRDAHFDGRHATEYMVTIGRFGALRQVA